MRAARIVDDLLPLVDDQLAVVGLVVAHDAFDQRDLPAPFSPSSAWNVPGAHLERHLVERGEFAETLDDVERLDAERLLAGGR